ncbi:MAG: NAD(P)H-dependent oxidoreductase, partial [Fluviicola sp.]|nr:NAD(P)H-dependent oxidoreductase [Fluviicola sp.]
FDSNAYDELLGLTDYHTVVVAALGFRAESDPLQHLEKVRKTTEQLFEYK